MQSTESTVAPWLMGAARTRVAEFSSQLRSLPQGASGSTPVPGLEWTVADLAQHVACLPNYWIKQVGGNGPFTMPDDFAAFSDQARAHITETDPGALADLIHAEFEALFDDLAGPVRERWLYGKSVSAAHICGLTVSELVMHGGDLAAVTKGKAPTFTRDEANAAVDGLLVTTPVFIDPDKAARQPDGVYHVSFRGGQDYTWTKQGPTLSIKVGRPAKPDARMSADPAMFLLSSLGRVSQVRAGLSGKLVSYGRKPWRFLGLGTMAADGV